MASSGSPDHGMLMKPRACIPCHERKVRCNASLAGTPCSRCMASGRIGQCRLVSLPQRATATRRKNYRTSKGEVRTQYSQAKPSQQPLLQPRVLDGIEEADVSQTAQGRSTSEPDTFIVEPSTTNSDDTVSEEDSQLEICRKISGWGDDHSTPTQVGCRTERREILEYYDGVNPTTILGELFGHGKPRRFVSITVRESAFVEHGQTEDAETANMDFLRRRGAFNLPSQSICEKLLQLYFVHVHPYTPILDRMAFLRGFTRGTYSAFLLQCMMTSVMPYVPSHLLSLMGLADRSTAQRFFFSKAQLLYDLEVEQSQLCLLQGSLMLTASHFAFIVDKDCRFWLVNAVRLATQMGLHRKEIANQLDRPTRRLFTRLFWVLYNKDVLMAIAGRANVRRLNDYHCDMPELTEDDWENEGDIGHFERFISPISRLQKLYLVQNTKLSRICARFIEMFRLPESTPTRAAREELEKAIHLWRKNLPLELYIETVEQWSDDVVWILVLRAMSYRLECVFYRNLRNLGDSGDDSLEHHALQKQQNAMLELSTVLDRIMLQDLVGCYPLSMTTCASTAVAMHIETALNTSSPSSKRQSSQIHIHKGLAYLRASSEYWDSVRCTLRMLEDIVDKTGLTLGSMDHQIFDLSSMSPFTQKPNKTSERPTGDGGKMAGAYVGVTGDCSFSTHPGRAGTSFPSPARSQVGNAEFTHETMVVDEDPETWLNDLLGGKFLATDGTWTWSA